LWCLLPTHYSSICLPQPNSVFKQYVQTVSLFCYKPSIKLLCCLQLDIRPLPIFGPPEVLQSDNGREFDNQLFDELKERCKGMQIIRGRPRHPQTQGSVEAANKMVERKLASSFEETGSRDWPAMLAGIMWAMNTVPHSAHRKSPYQMVFGRKPREQILRPGTTCEEQPIIDQADVEHLLTDIEQPAEIHESTAPA